MILIGEMEMKLDQILQLVLLLEQLLASLKKSSLVRLSDDFGVAEGKLNSLTVEDLEEIQARVNEL